MAAVVSSRYLPKTESKKDRVPIGPLLLIAFTVTTFMLLMMVAFAPEDFLRTSAEIFWPNGIYLLVLSICAVFYHYLHFKYRWPLFLEVTVPLLIGVLPIVVSVLKVGGYSLEFIFNLVGEESQRLFITVTAWLLSVFLLNTFYKLSLFPNIIEHTWSNKRLWDDAGIRFDIRPWRYERNKWQVSLMGLTVLGALFVNQSSLVKEALTSLLAQICFGVLLILTVILLVQGHFYYRRALWHVNGLEPDSGMEGIWRKWASGIVIVIFLCSMALPGDLRGIKRWWLLSFFARLFRSRSEFTYEGYSENTSPPIGNPEEMIVQVIGEENIIYSLIQGFFIIIIPLICIFCLLLLAGYSLNKFRNVEGRGLKGLPGLLLKFYLYWRAVYRNWRKKRLWSAAAKNAGGYKDIKSEDYLIRKGRRGYFWGDSLRGAVRRGYFKLIRRGRKHGFDWRSTLTPEEVADHLTTALPRERDLVAKIINDYRQARYAKEEPDAGLVRSFLRRVQLLVGKLKW